MTALVLLVSVPIWVRFAASLLGVADRGAGRDARPAAFRRLAVDTALLGAWLVVALEHAVAIALAAIVVLVGTVAGDAAVRVAVALRDRKRPDRKKETPATRDWGGEGKSSPGY